MGERRRRKKEAVRAGLEHEHLWNEVWRGEKRRRREVNESNIVYVGEDYEGVWI